MLNALIASSLVIGLLMHSLFPHVAVVLGGAGTPVVLTLLFLIGVQIGTNVEVLSGMRRYVFDTMLICLSAIIGSLVAACLYALIDPALSMRDASLVVSGLSFYSLSSILLNHAGLHSLAVLSFLTNLLRESLSLTFAPVLFRTFGAFAPIVATASASDSGAPVIARAGGGEQTVLCITCAFVLSLAVPVLVQLLLIQG